MRTLVHLVILSLALLTSLYSTAGAQATYSDNQWAAIVTIQQMARTYNVDEGQMLRVAKCESLLGEQPNGDGGHSLGLYQLNDRDTGLLWHFYRVGYEDPYNFNQAADYYARVLTGEWRMEGVTSARWSCQ